MQKSATSDFMTRTISPQKPTYKPTSSGAPVNSKSPIRNGAFTYDKQVVSPMAQQKISPISTKKKASDHYMKSKPMAAPQSRPKSPMFTKSHTKSPEARSPLGQPKNKPYNPPPMR